MNKPRILLTGATGFVGTQILAALKQQDCFVRATTRNNNQHGFADEYIYSNDIFSEPLAWWEKQLFEIDIVIHSAWYVQPGKYLDSVENTKCLDGSLKLLSAFINSQAKHFTGVGTCFEYDLSYGNLAVDTPLLPTSAYAKAKVDLFHAVQSQCETNCKGWSWCRLFYLYGEGEHANRLVPYLHSKLAAGEAVDLTSGTQVRDFMDVKEAGQMIADCAVNQNQGPVNICSGIPITVRELAEKIADQYGRRDLLNFGARKDNLVDPPRVVGVR